MTPHRFHCFPVWDDHLHPNLGNGEASSYTIYKLNCYWSIEQKGAGLRKHQSSINNEVNVSAHTLSQQVKGDVNETFSDPLLSSE